LAAHSLDVRRRRPSFVAHDQRQFVSSSEVEFVGPFFEQHAVD
jgi:hypothetical protein